MLKNIFFEFANFFKNFFEEPQVVHDPDIIGSQRPGRTPTLKFLKF